MSPARDNRDLEALVKRDQMMAVPWSRVGHQRMKQQSRHLLKRFKVEPLRRRLLLLQQRRLAQILRRLLWPKRPLSRHWQAVRHRRKHFKLLGKQPESLLRREALADLDQVGQAALGRETWSVRLNRLLIRL